METPVLQPEPEARHAGPPRAERTASAREDRMLRRFDYLAASLQKQNALEANLGSINAGLIGIAHSLGEMIEETLEAVPRNVESIQRLLPFIDTHLRVARQVDRFSQVELRTKARPTKTKLQDPLQALRSNASEDF